VTTRDTLGLALRNLNQAKLRTSLTTLGVSIGIASLAGMVSLGVGLQDQFVGRLTKSGLFDSITVLSAFDVPGGFARLGGAGRQGFGRAGGRGRGSVNVAGSPRNDLTDDTIKSLASLPHVRDVFPNVRVPLQMKFNGAQEGFAAAGVPMTAKGEGAFRSIAYGTFFPNDADMTCMLSLDLAKRMMETDPGSLVGQTVTLQHTSPANAASALAGALNGVPPQPEETPCRVVGIVERETGPGGIGVSVTPVMLPLGRAKTMVPRANVYQSLIVKVAGAQYTQDVEDEIKKKGLSAFSVNDALQGAKRAFIILDIVLSLIGSIALTVSSLGIVNTMVMSILEHARDRYHEGDRRQRRRRAPHLPDRGVRDRWSRRRGRRRAGLGRRPDHQHRREHLHPAAGRDARKPLLTAVLADRRGDRLFDRRQPAGRKLPGRPGREARPDPGATA
jgi:ABC-type antimicrobial peptide transport system permease subunit